MARSYREIHSKPEIKVFLDDLIVLNPECKEDLEENRNEIINNYMNHNFLNLKNYKIKKLPDSIGKLYFLRDIELSNTLIEGLPSPIKNIKHLIYVYLENTKISAFPEILCELYQLKSLSIKNSDISFLPQKVQNNRIIMKSLRHSSCFAEKYSSAENYFLIKLKESLLKGEKIDYEELEKKLNEHACLTKEVFSASDLSFIEEKNPELKKILAPFYAEVKTRDGLSIKL